jgi:hypothetical protein
MTPALRLTIAAAFAASVGGCATFVSRPPSRPVPAPPAPAAPVAHPAPLPSTAGAPGQKTARVVVPKAVKCVPDDLGPAPAYPDSDSALLQAGGAADRYQLMAAGRILRQQRLQKLEDAVKRCRNAGR